MPDAKTTVAAILAKAPKGKEDAGDGYDAEAHLHQAMEDFHRAAHADSPNYKAMASAFRSAFTCLDSEEEEGGGE